MRFKDYITERKGYEFTRMEFIKAIDKAIGKQSKKMLKKIYKDLGLSRLKPIERDNLLVYVHKLYQSM